jgi:hypothetical protein
MVSLESDINTYAFDKKDFEDFLDKFKRSYTKSGMYNLVNHYKGIKGFNQASIGKLLISNKDFDSFSWDLAVNPDYMDNKISKKILSKIASLLSKECKFVGWLNKNFLNRLFNIDTQEINDLFHKGSTILAKLSFFLNSRHKKKVDEESIMLLVNRIQRFSREEQLVSNLFCYVKPRNVTFSNINQKNHLLKYNMKNLNMLAIGLNKNNKAKIRKGSTFDKVKITESKPNGKYFYLKFICRK